MKGKLKSINTNESPVKVVQDDLDGLVNKPINIKSQEGKDLGYFDLIFTTVDIVPQSGITVKEMLLRKSIKSKIRKSEETGFPLVLEKEELNYVGGKLLAIGWPGEIDGVIHLVEEIKEQLNK